MNGGQGVGALWGFCGDGLSGGRETEGGRQGRETGDRWPTRSHRRVFEKDTLGGACWVDSPSVSRPRRPSSTTTPRHAPRERDRLRWRRVPSPGLACESREVPPGPTTRVGTHSTHKNGVSCFAVSQNDNEKRLCSAERCLSF